ncbi:MAG: tetratricopeptide repeat protein [Dysgonamonadaceae bacterium]|nr:tetratricopeptide repeat protein [Dysgonamonadaceae bacterium]
MLVLDKTIQEKAHYTEKKEHRIDSLRNLLRAENSLEQRYFIYEQLFNEFRRYNMHKSLSAAETKLIIAGELSNNQFELLSKMRIGEILGIMGMYQERLNILGEINRAELEEQHWEFYYHLHHSLYLLLSENATVREQKSHYDRLISQYRDSILQVIEPNSLGYNLVKRGKLIEQGRYDEALFLMTQSFERYGHDQARLGTIAYSLADIYERKGDIERAKQYLAISAIADLRNSVKGYIALRKLAVLLFQEGDIDRAYNYIKCSFEDAIFSGSQFRILEISEALPIIAAAYNKKMYEKNARLQRDLILISILSIVLILCIVLVVLQMKKLTTAKKSINNMYEDMKLMNKSLDDLNKKLSESNLIKEEYIGSIFSLCSAYINKMESYRININKKAKAKQIEDIRQLTLSTLIPNEQKELFGNFDAIFLNLYPKFVEQFNAMLKNEEKIVPKSGDILTPELRVYALIRLGITDSGKIATLLHYSPQTVYNYKNKIKSKLAITEEEFSVAVRKIGK